MASLNRTVRDTAASMSAPKPRSLRGAATQISVQRAKGGYISETSYKGTHEGPTYTPPVKAVHKNLSSVHSHMAEAFNDADAKEA